MVINYVVHAVKIFNETSFNNDKIDWTYMETLTQAIKKLLIKDLVLYTDQKISASKKVTANNKEWKNVK